MTIPSNRHLASLNLTFLFVALLHAAPAPKPSPLHSAPANRTDYFVRGLAPAGSGILWQTNGGAVQASFERDRFVLSARTKSGVESQTIAFRDSNPDAVLEALDPLPGKASFFLGNDKSRWASNLSTYSRLRYRNLYAGIDLLFYWNAGNLEYDFAVAPGADPQQIRLEIDGAPGAKVTASGDLQAGSGAVEALHRPLLYQNVEGGRKVIGGRFAALADGSIGFDLGDYDRNRELVIDPTLTLLYSTYLGGRHDDQSTAVALDKNGNSYILGFSASVDYPVSANAFQPELKDTGYASDGGSNINIVLTKISPNGTLLFSTFLGGSNADNSGGLALDAQGNAYLSGTTSSPDFPLTANAYQASLPQGAAQSVFLAELSPDGSSLLYSSLFTGAGNSTATGLDTTNGPQGTGVVLDSKGRVYLAGNAGPGLPTTAGVYRATIPPASGNIASFVAIFDLTQTGANSLVASTYYGSATPSGGQVEGNYVNAMILDANNNPWLAGQTADTNLPTTSNALQRTLSFPFSYYGYCTAGFLTQLSSDLTTLQYATFWSGPISTSNGSCYGRSSANRLATDQSGNIFLFGSTEGAGFPTTAGVIEPSFVSGSGETVGFLTKFSPDGTKEVWSTYASTSGAYAGGIAVGGALAIDSQGNPWIGGGTYDGVTTTSNAYQTASPTGDFVTNGYITQISSDGTQFLYSTYLAGQNYANTITGVRNSIVSALAFDSLQNLYITGSTVSTLFPLSANPYQSQFANGDSGANGNDIFFTILAQNAVITSIGPTVAGNNGDTTITVTGAGFSPASACSLVDGSTTIAANSVVVASDGSSIQCGFGLNGAGAGAYDLSITATGASPITQKAAITVQNGGSPNVWASVLGRSVIRVSTPTTFTVSYGNSGNVDAYFATLWITLSPGLTFSFPSGIQDPFNPDIAYDSEQAGTAQSDTSTQIPLIIPHVPAGFSGTLQFQITDQTLGDQFGVEAFFSDPWFQKSSDAMAAFAALQGITAPVTSSCTAQPALNSNTPANCLNYWADLSANAAVQQGIAFAAANSVPFDSQSGLLKTEQGVGYSFQAALNQSFGIPIAPATTASSLPGRTGLHPMTNVVQGPWSTPEITPATAAKGLGALTASDLIVGAAIAWGLGKVLDYDIASINGLLDQSVCGAIGRGTQTAPPTVTLVPNPCTPPGTQTLTFTLHCSGGDYTLTSEVKCVQPPSPKCPPAKSGCKPGGTSGSIDPNYKSGPVGDGSASQFVNPMTPLSYSIGFENEATATLPAASVVVTDQLDPTRIDLTTVSLGTMTFGSNLIAPPAGVNSYSTTYTPPGVTTYVVRIQGSLNTDTGLLTWTFQTIDPTTGLPPTDPTVGFLPPDTDGIVGQGSVSFVGMPKTGQTTGTTFSNQASVVFDQNAPIVTPVWINTLDANLPTSQVTALPTLESSTTFLVSWTGTDVGSGIVSYSVYVSDNGAPFTIWQNGVSANSATYTGQNNHGYGFFSIATDGAGNVQLAKTVADTTTTVSGPPLLSITKTHATNFMPGQTNATYTVTVANGIAAGPTVGTVTVTETVPQNMTLISMAGNGWSCPGGNTCTRSDSLGSGMSYPLTVTVSIAGGASGTLTNSVTVSGGGSPSATANDPTTISAFTSCDVGQYGNTSVADVQAQVNAALGSGTTGADLNSDGVINAVDIQIVINAALGFNCTGVL